jgi:hypothetical protein
MSKMPVWGAVALLVAGCGLSSELLGVIKSSPPDPPTIAGRVYGTGVGATTRVAIATINFDGSGRREIIDYTKVPDGHYSYVLPRTSGEEFRLFAFGDLNGNGKLDASEPSSEEAKCGSIAVWSPEVSSGRTQGKWVFQSCEDDNANRYDFSAADIRFAADIATQ